LAQTHPEDQRKRRRWLLLLLLLLSLSLGGAYYWRAQQARVSSALAAEEQFERAPTAAGAPATVVVAEAPVGALPDDGARIENDKAAAHEVQRARRVARTQEPQAGAPGADVIAEALLESAPTAAGVPADGALPGSFAEGGGAPVVTPADQLPPAGGTSAEANPAPTTTPPDAVTPFAPGGDGLPPGGTVLPTPVTPVPEPASWLMLLAGLGITSWLARRRA
jgi:hypothetical protein